MIKSVKLFNLEHDITVLIGANGVGKRRILNAIFKKFDKAWLMTTPIVANGLKLKFPTFHDDCELAMFNHPDSELHSWLYPHLYEALVELSKTKQVLLTTYNPSFLNYFQPRQIRIVESFTVIKTIDETDLRFINAMGLYDNRLGDLWYNNIFGGNPHE